MRAGPQVRGRARLGDESLHRTETHRKEGRRIFIHRTSERRDGIQMRPDRMIRHARIGGQHAPQVADVRCAKSRFRAEAPEGKLREAVVGYALRIALDQVAEVGEAHVANVRGVNLVEFSEVDLLAR